MYDLKTSDHRALRGHGTEAEISMPEVVSSTAAVVFAALIDRCAL